MQKKIKLLLVVLSIFAVSKMHAQTSCDDFMRQVQAADYGSSYTSFSSDAIAEVSFYELKDSSYNTSYFAIVQFKSSYQEYIYQVDSNTEFNYSLDYKSSAGKAFWKHIHPYKDVLGCAPNFN